MGWQIIKQPNGKYCIFSSIVDNVVYYDGTPEQILEAIIDVETTPIRRRVNETISQLDRGEKPYHQFTKSFDEMIKWIETVHGKKESAKVLSKLK